MDNFNPNPKTIEDLNKMTKSQLSVFTKNTYDGYYIRHIATKNEGVGLVAGILGLDGETCPECGNNLTISVTVNVQGYQEQIGYCDECGYTETE